METLKVLVVDDELGMRTGVERSLRGVTVDLPDVEGAIAFDVRLAETGEEALDAIAADRPDILLLDYKLPGISGLDVLQSINGSGDDMLTIMITAYASLETAVTATKRGAYDFLAKPFTPDELRITLRKATKHLMLQRRARQLAEEKRRLRFQFISVVSHELKAPIGAIRGYLDMLQNPDMKHDEATVQHMLNRCGVRLDGMHKLILDLLDLTRIESGQKRRELQDVDAMAVARDSIEAYQAAAADRDITIVLNGPDTLEMTADPGELEIVLNNLVSNAVKYNRDGGTVNVTLACEDSLVTITVADTGIGMAPEDVERLFGEFTRIKNAKTRNIMGSGLGLSILKRLADLAGGDVTVASEVDKGTTFTVTLERRQQQAEAD